MVSSSSHDLPLPLPLPQKSLQIKQDDKFFSRLLSKETSMANSSLRVLYYGGTAGAIPFQWESRPGTPKHTFSDTSLPPLTPPPYYFNSKGKPMQKHSKPNIFYAIFPGFASKKSYVSSLSSAPSISSSRSYSSSYSLPSTLMNLNVHRRCNELDDDERAFESPTSTLCFGARHESSNGFRGCFRWRT